MSELNMSELNMSELNISEIEEAKKAIEKIDKLQSDSSSSIANLNDQFEEIISSYSSSKEGQPFQLVVIASTPKFNSKIILAEILNIKTISGKEITTIGKELSHSSNLSPNIPMLQSSNTIYVRRSLYPSIWNECKRSLYFNQEEVACLDDDKIIDQAIIPNHLFRFFNTVMFDNLPDLEGIVLAIGEQISYNSYCFMELLGDLHSNGLLQDIFNDSKNRKLRFLVHLYENTTETRSFSSQFYSKLCQLYGQNNLLENLDLVRQILYRLVHYQWSQIAVGYTEMVKQLTFKLPLPAEGTVAELPFNQIANLIKQQFVKNDGRIDYQNVTFHQNFWKSVISYVRRLTDQYEVLKNKCEGEIAHTVTFLTDELKIGNEVYGEEIIDPISHEAIRRSQPSEVYYHMESSGTLYLFNKQSLKQYILHSGDISNPCTRTSFDSENLKQIGFTQSDFSQLQAKLIEKSNGNSNSNGQQKTI